MFHNSTRRHPVQTFQFWFVVLTCFAVVSAWKLDFFSFPDPELPVLTDEPMPPPPQQAEPPESSASFSPTQAPREIAELGEFDVRHVVRTPAAAAELASSEDSTSASEMPAESQVEPFIRTASLEAADQTSDVVLATVEHKQPAAPAQSAVEAELSIDLAQADRLVESGEDVAALRLLSGWYWQLPQLRPQFQDRLSLLSRRIYFSPEPHYLQPYAVQFGDRLDSVSRRYQLTREYLAKLNRLDAAPLRAGQTLKVVQGPFSAVVDVSDHELTVHAQGYYLIHFPVGFGTDSSIPEGTFRVTDKVLNPDYYGPGGVITHQEAGNPLGTRWMTINDGERTLQGFGLHGTTDATLVGQTGGPGWMRMRQRDIEAVYDLLTVGSELIIHP